MYRLALASSDSASTRADARLLNDIGSAHHQLGYLDSAGWYLGRALDLRARLEDSLGLAGTLSNLGRVQQTLGRPDSAASLFSAALPLRRRGGRLRLGLGATLNNLGYSLDLQRRPDEALERYREASRRRVQLGTSPPRGWSGSTWDAQLALGRLDSARAAVVEGLGIKRTVADSTGVSWGLVDLGRVQLAEGDRGDALRSLQDARARCA